MAKHRVPQIYCCPKKMKNEVMRRWKNNAWNEKEGRNDALFWDHQKKQYLEENPTHAQMFAEFEAEAENEDEDGTIDIG